MAYPSPTPPFVDDPSALLVIDWSWWLNKAFAIGAVSGMTSILVGWLNNVIADRPAHIALALDPPGLTFRHRMRHPFDEHWKYKDGREIKPEEFHAVSSRCTQIAEMHSIPALWADDYEADDVIATVVRKARAAGYRVWICSADKDLEGLVDESDTYGILSGMWDNSARTIKGPIEVEQERKVQPAQIADFLAITGDSGDNVPGVKGLGPEKASMILRSFGTLESALSATPGDVDELSRAISEKARMMKKAPKDSLDALAVERAAMMGARNLAKYHRTLVEHADVARFSRELTGLDCDAPVDVPWSDIPLGGFDAHALRAQYAELGFTNKFSQVSAFRKRAPWAIGYNG